MKKLLFAASALALISYQAEAATLTLAAPPSYTTGQTIVGNYSSPAVDTNNNVTIDSRDIVKFLQLGASPTPAGFSLYNPPGFYNWGPLQASNILKDIANVSSTGTKVAGRWAWPGDSTGAGLCAVTCTIGQRSSSLSMQLEKLMYNAGIPVTADSALGCGLTTSVAACEQYDPRIVMGSSYIVGSPTYGGNLIGFPANTAAQALTYNFAQPINQCDIYTVNGIPNGSINGGVANVVVDKGGVTTTGSTITMTHGTIAVQKTTLTWSGIATNAPINFNVLNSTQSNYYIIGLACRDTNNPKIEFYAGGLPSSSSTTWTQTSAQSGYAPNLLLTSANLNPTETFNALGINDRNPVAPVNGGGTPVTPIGTYFSNEQTMQTQANSTGGNMFINGMLSDPSNSGGFATYLTQAQYGNVLKSLSLSANQPYIDLTYRWGTFANGCALGFYGIGSDSGCDPRHGSASGYADQAAMLWGGISSLVGNEGQSPVPQYFGVTPLLGGSALTAGQCSSTVVSEIGVTTNMVVNVTAQSDPGVLFIPRGYVSSANNVTVEICSIAAGTPTATNYNFRVN